MGYKHKSGDLSENPPTAEHLFRGFHGRGVRNVKRSMLPIDNLKSAQCLGRSNVIFYLSDKRDPNDPKGEGAQGFKKRFFHTQGPPAYLYVIDVSGDLDSFQQGLVNLCRSKGVTKRAIKPTMRFSPRMKLVQLGDLEKVELSVGREEFELGFEGYKLFVMEDMKTLMALPIVNGNILDANVYVWGSDHTRVNWRGIIK